MIKFAENRFRLVSRRNRVCPYTPLKASGSAVGLVLAPIACNARRSVANSASPVASTRARAQRSSYPSQPTAAASRRHFVTKFGLLRLCVADSKIRPPGRHPRDARTARGGYDVTTETASSSLGCAGAQVDRTHLMSDRALERERHRSGSLTFPPLEKPWSRHHSSAKIISAVAIIGHFFDRL